MTKDTTRRHGRGSVSDPCVNDKRGCSKVSVMSLALPSIRLATDVCYNLFLFAVAGVGLASFVTEHPDLLLVRVHPKLRASICSRIIRLPASCFPA